MLSHVFRRFKLLSLEKKHMLFLFWVYEFANTTSGLFVNVFVFLQTGSIAFLALFVLVQFAGVMIGFIGIGYAIAQLQYSMKWNYLRSFSIYFLAFVWLAFTPHTTIFLLVFSFLNGLGLGIFWLGNHSYEIVYTKNGDGDRDFYSSMVQSGTQAITIVAPLVGTILLFLAEQVLHTETFTLLFYVLPLIYLISLPFLFKLPHFIPGIISKAEVRSFFNNKKERIVYWYYFLTGTQELKTVAIVFFSIVALKTAINIGTWETVVGVISLFLIVLFAAIRREENRISIMLYAILGFSIAFSFVAFSDVSPFYYVAYSLIMVIFRPMYRISQHTIDLYSMDLLGKGRSSFYVGLLYREVMLYSARFLTLGLVILLALFIKDTMLVAQITLVIYVISLIINWFVAKKLLNQTSLVK